MSTNFTELAMFATARTMKHKFINPDMSPVADAKVKQTVDAVAEHIKGDRDHEIWVFEAHVADVQCRNRSWYTDVLYFIHACEAAIDAARCEPSMFIPSFQAMAMVHTLRSKLYLGVFDSERRVTSEVIADVSESVVALQRTVLGLHELYKAEFGNSPDAPNFIHLRLATIKARQAVEKSMADAREECNFWKHR